MANDSGKEPELKDWDRRPWPKQGNPTREDVYQAVGQALSHWEHYEAALSLLFAALVGNFTARTARRAYNAIRTFEGRAEMLRAASETYFHEHPHTEDQATFKQIFRDAKNYSPRRNDIAHGVVEYFSALPYGSFRLPASYCLYPSFAAYKDRDHEEAPEYCYTSVELNYFAGKFWMLQYPPYQLSAAIYFRETGRGPSLEKRPSPDPA